MNQRPPGPVGYVGLVTRAVALIIDALAINLVAVLVGGVTTLIASLFGWGSGLNSAEAVAGAVLWWLWISAYFVLFWSLTALILVGLGELLTRLLHFETGSLSIAGGIILVIIAVTMVLGSADPREGRAIKGRDPMRIAVFPLAIPYLLNPVGIVTLVTLSAEANSPATFALVLGLLAVVGAIDIAVFRGANRMSDHLDESRMLITEKVFGFLLAAIAVQLMLDGLQSVGAIQLSIH